MYPRKSKEGIQATLIVRQAGRQAGSGRQVNSAGDGERMDGWMDGWMDTDGRMDGCLKSSPKVKCDSLNTQHTNTRRSPVFCMPSSGRPCRLR
jgi:hypothetical protein